MSKAWDQRTYPVIFQLRTESIQDRVNLYCSSNNWTSPIAQLLFAYEDSTSSQKAKYIYHHTLSLVPGTYEYKYQVQKNNKVSWMLNTEKKTRNNNNLLAKDDFIQLIVERCDLLEREGTVGIWSEEKTTESDIENKNVNYCNVGMSLFKKPIYYDTELIINKTQHYKAHRAILSVHSGYFKVLFDNENIKYPAKIELKVDDLQIFHAMFKFLYTGTIPSFLRYEQFKLLLQAANEYQIPALVEIIQQHSASMNVTVNNCLLLLSMENELQQDSLRVRRLAIDMVAENFQHLCHQNLFLDLKHNTIQDIISSTNLQIPNKRIVTMALHRWLSANRATLPDLSQSITTLQRYIPSTYRTASFSSIVCYFADGSVRYTNMTINAINSFLKSTPQIMVGLLVNDDDTKDRVMSAISKDDHYRILCKYISKTPHFTDWNPTQYKLDILLFLEHGFNEIYWMDSDTVVYQDLRPILVDFRHSDKLFYFTLDHVMYDPTFVNTWKQQHQETFIPQACFMGFKSSCMRTFFGLWKDAWKMWIEPAPFTMYQDPNPGFIGSAFCTEQYALGNAVTHFTAQEALSRNRTHHPNDFILPIKRKLISMNISGPLHAFYPSSKLKSMVARPTIVSSLYYYFSLDLYTVKKTSLCNVYDCRISGYISKYHSTYMTCFSNPESFIDSFFDCIFHFYNQNYQPGYEWYLKLFVNRT